MKTTLQLIFSCLGVLILFNSNAQRGKEGNQIISTPNTVVNTYTNLTATAAAGTSTLTVGNNAMIGGSFGGTPLAPGDLIMVIQMQGAVLNCDTYPNDNGWGTYTIPAPYRWSNSWKHHAHEWGALIHLNIFGNPTNGYGNSGKFEEIEVLSVTGGTTIELGCDLTNTYDGAGHVQIVRIPRYDTLTITGSGSIIPNLWNGTIGGVVDIEVNSHLDINAGGLISADATGFRGGELDNFGTVGSIMVLDDVKFLGTSDPALGSEKGEGIHGYYTELDAIASRYGISGASNGGGGGGFQNCGGGGGSNVYAGTLRYTGTGIPNPLYNVNWALDFSYPDFNLDPQTYSNLVGRPSPGGGRGGYSLAINDNNENTIGPRQAAWGGDGRKPNGGRGGHPLVYDATRIFLGGGGGAGDQDSFQGGKGGDGGGIIHITTYGTFVGDGTISADGEDGEKTNPTNQNPGIAAADRRKGNDGAGGGGAGGSVLIENAVAIPATIAIQARGGNGGNQDMRLYQNPGFGINTADEASGPGGSGGGGNIAFNSGAPTQDVAAGLAGTIITQNFEGGVYTTIAGMVSNHAVNGATDGYPGEQSLAAPYFDIAGTDTTICVGQSVNLTVSTLGTFLAGLGNADVTWYTQQFCDPTTNIQGTGLTITVTPAATTTYWVGICPGKWRIPVVVTVTLGATLVTTDPAALCLPATADISIPVITAGSDVGTLTYWQDNGMTTPIVDETEVGAGWHYINLSLGGGCEALDSIFVTINPLDDATFVTSDFCASTVNTISAVASPGGTYTITGQTGSGLVTINSGTGILSNYLAGDQVTIEYTTPVGGCQNTSAQVVNVTPLDDASFTTSDFCFSSVNVVSAVALPGGSYAITSQTGSGLVTINSGTGVLSNYVAGDQITIEYTTPAGGCQNTSTQIVNATPLDDASFTTVDFCASTVNTISAVGTPGGTYTITGQTGSGFATADGATGVLANFVVGDQVTIEYTTPAGGCQNSSTQIVNVLPLDDATFVSTDFCASATNTISAVASPGGTYTIIGQTGSGLATINSSTGVLADYIVGDQVTIEYTTPSGGCTNTFTQIVNVTPLDDASFTTSDFCEASVNVISAVAIPGGTFVIAGQTGSGLVTISGSTGVLANYVAGDQITIEYTTPAGGCQNTSTQVINVTAQDDASFTSVDFCESSVNAISAVAFPGGTFAIAIQSGSAIIDGTTGILSGYAAGDQITIEYTTPAGSCQNSSTQIVNVVPTDNGVFTMTATCDGGTVNLTGLAGGVFSFLNVPTDDAMIDPATGTVSGGTNGTNYDVEFTTNGLCPLTTSQSVVGLDLDDASFILTPTCDGATATVLGTVEGSFAFSIAPVDTAIINASTGDISGGDFNTSYAVVYNTAGACPASSIENVIVDDCSVPLSIVIPTAFTPGSDGVNGTWKIQDLDNNYPDNSIIVYNRWGSVVFKYTSSAASPYSLNEWDGTFKGQELPVASYYFIITGNDGSDDSFKGTVTIVRN